jgi:hypothetical protein
MLACENSIVPGGGELRGRQKLFHTRDTVQTIQVDALSKPPCVLLAIRLIRQTKRETARLARLDPPQPKLLEARRQVPLHRATHSRAYRSWRHADFGRWNDISIPLAANPRPSPPERPTTSIDQLPLRNQLFIAQNEPNLDGRLSRCEDCIRLTIRQRRLRLLSKCQANHEHREESLHALG